MTAMPAAEIVRCYCYRYCYCYSTTIASIAVFGNFSSGNIFIALEMTSPGDANEGELQQEFSDMWGPMCQESI